jgi:hypothetical protein
MEGQISLSWQMVPEKYSGAMAHHICSKKQLLPRLRAEQLSRAGDKF